MKRVSKRRHRPDVKETRSHKIGHQAYRLLNSFENKVRKMVIQGRYKDAIGYVDEHFLEILEKLGEYEITFDMCELYSFKIMGVCYSKDIRQKWSEEGYQPPHWIEMGNALFDAGKYEEAIEAYSRRIKEDSHDDRAWYLMGCAHRAMGNPYESEEAWETALSIVQRDHAIEKLPDNPDDAKRWAELGDIEYNQKNWKAAAGAYSNSLSVNPDQPDIWFKKGCCHYDLGELEKSLESFRNAVELKPHNYFALNDLGVVYCRLGQVQEGVRQFQMALEAISEKAVENGLIKRNLEKAQVQPDSNVGSQMAFLYY